MSTPCRTTVVGVPKEIKEGEGRVSVTPAGAAELVAGGHEVLVQRGAGVASGWPDAAYVAAGADLADTAGEVFAAAQVVVKVKEPLMEEMRMLRAGQELFTFYHLSGATKTYVKRLVATGAVGIAYETLVDRHGAIPLLRPMSEVAGRMAAVEAAKLCGAAGGVHGRGLLLGGVTGTERGKVLVLGGGVVGMNAAEVAAGLGADVTVLTRSHTQLRNMAARLPKNVHGVFSRSCGPLDMKEHLPQADVVIGAVLVPGVKAPRLVTREMLGWMKPGAVVVDVSIDQGGCFETSRPTTLSEPSYTVDSIVHYCVANMPGAYPRTSTAALTNASLPYVLKLASHGWAAMADSDACFAPAVNFAGGALTNAEIAATFEGAGLPYTPVGRAAKAALVERRAGTAEVAPAP